MSEAERRRQSLLARMAGNIAAGLVQRQAPVYAEPEHVATQAVAIAKRICELLEMP